MHPYLWSTDSPSPINFSDVGPLLRTCTTCHAAGIAPAFTTNSYPFRSDARENTALLRRIFGAASGSPNYARMPPGTQPALPGESLAKLREWISTGALDEHLQPTLTDADSREVLDD